jgi:hypothetical protein
VQVAKNTKGRGTGEVGPNFREVKEMTRGRVILDAVWLAISEI